MNPSTYTPYIPDELIHTPTEEVTENLSEFFSFETDGDKLFSYTIHKKKNGAKNPEVMYQSNPLKLYASQYFTIDGAFLNMYMAQGPFFGLGERAGPFFYEKEANGVHTRFTYDQPNPREDAKANPPGKNYYGFQPFYGYLAKS